MFNPPSTEKSVSYSLRNADDGFAITPATGTVIGNPETAGDYEITVIALNSDNDVALVETLLLTVNGVVSVDLWHQDLV